MDRIDLQEKVWGFIFGVVAIIAAILEMIVNGFSVASVLGAIKDVFGTLVVVVVFYLIVMNRPKRPKNITDILENMIENWGLDNAPLIFKTEGYVSAKDSEYTQGFVLLQEPKKYPLLAGLTPDKPNWIDYAQYKSPKKLTGKFLDMPAYNIMTSSAFNVLFVMEQKHFQDREIDEIIRNIINAIDRKYDDLLKVERIGNSAKFKIVYKQICTVDDIEFFKDSLDFVLSLVKVVV